MARRTFIHHDGALGDLLLSLPAIRLIRENSGPVHLAGRSDAAELLRETGYAEETSPAGMALFSSLYTGHAGRSAGEFLSGFERAFVFTVKREAELVAALRELIPRAEQVVTIPPPGTRMHVSEFRVQQLLASGMRPAAGAREPVSIEIPPLWKEKAGRLLSRAGYRGSGRPLAAMHPGSGGTGKCWPAGNFFRLAGALGDAYNAFVLIFSGPAEDRDLQAEIHDFANSRRGVLHVCNEELTIVSALLEMCGLYIGNDSGITHLASAVNGRVVALFGPTDPLLWRPCGKNTRIISSGVECAPCGPKPERPPGCRRECLTGISVETLYEACRVYMDVK